MLRLLEHNILLQFLTRLVSNPYLVAIREGLTLTLPVILAGTIAILLNSFPLDAYQNYMVSVFGEQWKLFGVYIHNGTFGVISVVTALSISHSLAEDYNTKNPLDKINPSIFAVITFSCLICTMEPINGALSLRWLGVLGLLLAILTALASCFLFQHLLRFPSLRMTFYSGSISPSMAQVMSALFPAIITIMIFAAYKTLTRVFGIENPSEIIYTFLYIPFQSLGGDYLSTALIYGFARHALWFLGVHGSNVLEPVMMELYVPAIQENIGHYLQGLEPLKVFTKPFFDCYTSLGGSGASLGLLLACLLCHKDNGAKKIARISIIPSVFNINELLLFGLPVVLNPIFFIPFIMVPLVNTVVAYFATIWGLVPMTINDVAWNIPVFINGYLATDSISGVFLQVLNLAMATAIYIPFVRLDNKIKANQFNDNFKKLVRFAIDGDVSNSGPRLLSQPGAVGGLAYNLASDMKAALKRGEIYLEYQPQVNSDTGRVYGVESLMRWKHPHIGRIPPPVFIGLGEDTGYIVDLGLWGFEQSVRQMEEWYMAGMVDLIMSVNVSAIQLEDPNLPDNIMRILNHYRVPVANIKLEVTESIALTSHMIKNEVLARLHALNIQLAIDDFGMGHSSLTYLKKFPVSSLKLDGILSRDVLASRSSCEIISSIAELCLSLNINLIAEYVEDEEHLLKLRSLGCPNIQGYFYSPPLSADDTFLFMQETHKAYGPFRKIEVVY